MGNQSNAKAICNMCGKKLDGWDIQEDFGFDYYIGYGSRHDMEHTHARFCCECFDRILDRLVDVCKVSPIVEKHGFAGQLTIEDFKEMFAADDQGDNHMEDRMIGRSG